jgi:hypothetical protein
MKCLRLIRLVLPAALLAAVVACSKSNDVTGANGALGRLSVSAPDSAVSGSVFRTDISALNVGVQGIHNGMVQVTLPGPLTVNSVDASPGTSATFTAGPGASVTWTLNTLDANTQSTLHIETVGTLPAGSAAMTVRIQASMTADGINAGDATAFKDVQITP